MTPEQQVLFFGTPINVFSLAKMRIARLTAGKKDAYLLAAWYVQLRDMAKQGTRFGHLSTNTVCMADAIGAPRPDDDDPELFEWVANHAKFWEAMIVAGLIDVRGDVTGVHELFRVEVLDYEETNVARRARVTAPSRDVTMTPAERSAVRREQSRRDAAGIARMSDDERDSWVLERRTSRRHVTSRHVTPKGEERTLGIGDDRGAPTANEMATYDRHRRELDTEERYAYAHERTGSARAELAAVPKEREGEPLHDSRGSGQSVTDPGSGTAATSADALTTPGSSLTHSDAGESERLTAKRDQLGGAA